MVGGTDYPRVGYLFRVLAGVTRVCVCVCVRSRYALARVVRVHHARHERA